MTKLQQLQIRVTDEQKAQIRCRAADARMDVSKWVLSQILPPETERFQSICAALAHNPGNHTYLLADLNDFLSSRNAKVFILAVRESPRIQLPTFEANYVAAMVAHTAALHLVEAPRWINTIKPLEKPWFASNLKGLRLLLLTNSPPAFRSRNLFIDSSIGDRV